MTCASCKHYRPNKFGNRCALHDCRVRPSEWCNDHEPAPRESVDEWLAKHGPPKREPVRPDYSRCKAPASTLTRNQRRQRTDMGFTWLQ
jgi:hypothetical protein